MTKAAALREYAGMLDAEPVAWLYTCQKPGTQTVYASVDENDSYHWPVDQWKSIVKTPLFAHPPAPTQREHITDGSPCWCSPDLDYVDPETGAKVWLHKESQ